MRSSYNTLYLNINLFQSKTISGEETRILSISLWPKRENESIFKQWNLSSSRKNYIHFLFILHFSSSPSSKSLQLPAQIKDPRRLTVGVNKIKYAYVLLMAWYLHLNLATEMTIFSTCCPFSLPNPRNCAKNPTEPWAVVSCLLVLFIHSCQRIYIWHQDTKDYWSNAP